MENSSPQIHSGTETAKQSNVFKNKTFLAVWIGDVVSQIGNGFHTVALGLIILEKTGSALAMSSIFAAQFLAFILISPFAGTYCDRTDRRRLMIQTDIIRIVLVLLLVWVLSAESINVIIVICLSFFISMFGAFFGPAFDSSIIHIVKKAQVARASSIVQMTGTIAQIVGPIVGGIVVVAFSASTALTIDALSFLLSAVAVFLVNFPSPAQNGKNKSSFLQDMKEGLLFLKGEKVILGVTVLGPLFALFGSAYAILVPVIGVKIWDVTGFQYGILTAGYAIGSAIAAGLMTIFSEKVRKRGPLIITVFSLAGLSSIIAPLMPIVWFAIPFIIIDGLFSGAGITIMVILLRTIVASEKQGRVFGFYRSAANALWPVGAFAAGFFADRMSPITVAVVCGVGFMLTGLLGCLNRKLRAFD